MEITPPIRFNPDQYADILTAHGLHLDWLNEEDGDPFGRRNLTRAGLLDAARAVPRHYRTALADHPKVVDWVRTVAETARDQAARGQVPSVTAGPSLLLLGRTGTGKTHQAYGAVRLLSGCGVRTSWVVTTGPDLYASLRPRHGVDAETEFRRYRDARLLLVDDIGAAKPSEFTEEINFRLINHRYENELPTLMTSNVEPRDMQDRLGDRVTSRLAEMCQRVVIAGTDRRRAA
ncbi:ATP-binding protein [Streptomyces syringium]|uniref:ATP-binding protein n=1 Tax=Streptomyces syringium TaxID=76729 RepID=UPI003456A500